MTIPDYISPIVGYRTWQWDSLGLKSLNNERWFPGQALAAACQRRDQAAVLARFGNQHEPPHDGCTCGIYAAKNYDHFCNMGYFGYGVLGEVYLWGKIWQHDLGYRAQYAYPKNFLLSDGMPESRLMPLIAYGVDIFIAATPPDLAAQRNEFPQDIPLWTRASGYNQAGFDLIRRRHERWGIRR